MKLLHQDDKTPFGKFMDLKNENATLRDIVKNIESNGRPANNRASQGQPSRLKVETITAPPPGIKWHSSITPRSARKYNIDPSNSPPPSPRSTAVQKNAPSPPVIAHFEQKPLTDRSGRQDAPGLKKERIGHTRLNSMGYGNRNSACYSFTDKSTIETDRQQLLDFNIGEELTLSDKLTPRPPTIGNGLVGLEQQDIVDDDYMERIVLNNYADEPEVSIDSDAIINERNAFTGRTTKNITKASSSQLSNVGDKKIVLSTSKTTATGIREPAPTEITEAIDNYSNAVKTARALGLGNNDDKSIVPIGVTGLLISRQHRDTAPQLANSISSTSSLRKLEV